MAFEHEKVLQIDSGTSQERGVRFEKQSKPDGASFGFGHEGFDVRVFVEQMPSELLRAPCHFVLEPFIASQLDDEPEETRLVAWAGFAYGKGVN
jgi:hypothetical protein